MIIAKNLGKSYGELSVLKGVNLHVKRGEVVAIVGDSGAGKTTLLQILGTLDRADQGELMINGQSVTKLSHQQLAQFRNLNIGFVFQFHHLLPEFTALENVAIPGYIAKKPRKDVELRAKTLLEKLSLGARTHHKPGALSGGEQQRVAVARALINEPAIVLADEPSGNLDSKNADYLHQLFFDLRDEFGQTFAIVTHNKELARMADRMLTMVDGSFEVPLAAQQ